MVAETVTLVPGYIIRSASAEDVDLACEIAKKAWVPIHESFAAIMGEEMHAILYANWEEGKAAQVRGHFEQHPDWLFVVVDERVQEVVGFITFRMDEDKSLGEIGNNAIVPAVQGRGLGTAMHRFVLDRFREMGLRFAAVSTGMDEGHGPARRAYEKVGFDIAREDVTYYMEL